MPEARQPQIGDILTALIDERGAIVSSADCSEMELAFARAEGRFYVDADGFGFVLRMRDWRANAEAALHDVKEQHRRDKVMVDTQEGENGELHPPVHAPIGW